MSSVENININSQKTLESDVAVLIKLLITKPNLMTLYVVIRFKITKEKDFKISIAHRTRIERKLIFVSRHCLFQILSRYNIVAISNSIQTTEIIERPFYSPLSNI